MKRGPFVQGLRCRECARLYPAEALHVCEWCFGPLEVVYDYEAISESISRQSIAAGPRTIWRYADLLPASAEGAVDLGAGLTPLLRADRLGAELGLSELWLKNDTVNPTGSFKDRVVSVALTRRGNSVSRWRPVPPPATWPTPWPPTRRELVCVQSYASRPTSRWPRWSLRRSSEACWWPSTATTTRSTACAPSWPASTRRGRSSTSTSAATTRRGPRRWRSRWPSSWVGRRPTTS